VQIAEKRKHEIFGVLELRRIIKIEHKNIENEIRSKKGRTSLWFIYCKY